MNLPLAHSLALSLHSTHPLSCRFLAGLNESFPTRCGRSCGMPFLLENRPKTVKKISRGAAPDPLSLPISGRAPRQSGPLAEAQRGGRGGAPYEYFTALPETQKADRERPDRRASPRVVRRSLK